MSQRVPEELITAREVARMLRTSTATVYRMARNRRLEFVLVGQTSVRFRPSDVAAYQERNRSALAGTTARMFPRVG